MSCSVVDLHVSLLSFPPSCHEFYRRKDFLPQNIRCIWHVCMYHTPAWLDILDRGLSIDCSHLLTVIVLTTAAPSLLLVWSSCPVPTAAG